MAIQSNFPAIRPSLLLDFANSKRLDPRITFTRASTARYYDGSTVAKAEENLFTQSQAFNDTSAWNSAGSQTCTVTANTAAAPDGTTTADTFAETAATGSFAIQSANTPTLLANTTYTFSVFAQNVDVRYVGLTLWGASSNYGYVEFDLTGVAVNRSGAAGTGWSVVSSSITSAGGSWYRLVATITAGTTVTTPRHRIFLSNGSATIQTSGLPEYTGTTKSAYFWGAQLEQRSAVTAYTATTTQAITNYVPQLLTAQNNVPRFDHNPTTGESLGLLIEEQRTNLALQSEAFGTTWGATRSFVTTNILVGPDGTLTADKVYENTTASNSHYVAQTISLTSGTSYTFSVYAKAGERTQVRLRVDGTAMFANAQFNLSSGVVSSGTGTITNVGNGWYRCSVTGTSDLTGSNTVAIYLLDGSGATNYTGDGYSGLYVWGAQLEAGAFATSYIPTTAASATRQADAASMTGTNFSSWYDAAEGTVYAESAMAFVATTRNIVAAISNATVTNSIAIGQNTGGSRDGRAMLWVTANGNDQAYIGPTTTISSNVAYRFAGTYKVNDFATSLNAEAAQTDTLGTVPVVSQLNIGARGDLASGSWLNGTIRKLAYYPARLTNAQLQAITG